MRTHLALALLLLGACSGNGSNEKVQLVNGASGDGNDTADGSGGGHDDGNGGGDGANGHGNGADGSGGGHDGDAGTGAGGSDGVDPKDPPKATEPCGEDLDVHNGAVLPDFGDVPSGGTFDGDPLGDGALKVVSEDKTLKNPDASRNDYKVTAYAPSTDGSKPDAGPFPLLVLLPGFSGNHTGYGHFTNHFVSHGVAVLGVTAANVTFTDKPNNPANVAEIENAITWALEESQLAGKIDEDKLAIAGHSQGGKLAFFTAVTDPRFKLVIGWDPQNGGGAPCFVAGLAGQNCDMWPVAPVCDKDRKVEDSGMMANIRAESLVFAARDTNITPDKHLWAENFYRGAPSPAHLVLFPSAGHGDWAATGATTDVSKRVQMALVLTRFFGKKGLDKYLPDGEYLKGESSVEVHNK